MQKWSDAHANGLIELGIQPGDTIAVWFHEGAEKVSKDCIAQIVLFISTLKCLPQLKLVLK